MRALRPMTQEEREFAEQRHDLVIDFIDGFVLREAARLLKMPRAAAVSCMEDFCCRARAVIG